MNACVATRIRRTISSVKPQDTKLLGCRFYWVEDEGGDAEVNVTNLAPEGDADIIEIDKGRAVLQLSIGADYTADLSYDDSGTASYDEGDLVYVEHRNEEIEDKEELVVEVEVAYEDMDPSSFEIVSVTVTEPSEGFGIKNQDARDCTTGFLWRKDI